MRSSIGRLFLHANAAPFASQVPSDLRIGVVLSTCFQRRHVSEPLLEMHLCLKCGSEKERPTASAVNQFQLVVRDPEEQCILEAVSRIHGLIPAIASGLRRSPHFHSIGRRGRIGNCGFQSPEA